MTVKVKICGITNLEDALHASKCGADELGFNFFQGSKRYVSPEVANEIASKLPASTNKIGVFVNESIDTILKIADLVPLSGIQLHGDEELTYLTALKQKAKQPIIKAFRVSSSFDIGTVLDWDCDFQLFDSFSSDQYGGTGRRLTNQDLLFHIYLWLPGSAYVAGGLNPENVAEVIREADPYAVDVASGVESQPGKKDPKKVEAFIRNAKNA